MYTVAPQQYISSAVSCLWEMEWQKMCFGMFSIMKWVKEKKEKWPKGFSWNVTDFRKAEPPLTVVRINYGWNLLGSVGDMWHWCHMGVCVSLLLSGAHLVKAALLGFKQQIVSNTMENHNETESWLVYSYAIWSFLLQFRLICIIYRCATLQF